MAAPHPSPKIIFKNILTQAEFFHELSRVLLTMELDEILRFILHGIHHILGLERLRLFLVDEQGKNLELLMTEGHRLTAQQRCELIHPLQAGASLVAQVAITGKPVLVKDVAKDLRVDTDHVNLLALKHSCLLVPLPTGQKRAGVIVADNALSGKIITKEDLYNLETFAGQAAIAIRNARLYKELQEKNQKLQEAQQQLVETAKMAALGEFSYGVAHQLNNPLAIIKNAVKLLKNKIPEEKRNEYLEIIENHTDQAAQTIRELLLYSRASSGSPALKTEAHKSKVQINDLIKKAVVAVEQQFDFNKIKIIYLLATALPEIKAHENGLKQVFINLLTNAYQALEDSNSGKIKISSEIINTKNNKEMIEIQFQDNGSGIPEEDRDKIFDPFFSTKLEQQGSGLGLALSASIISQHKGQLTLEGSQKKKGSTFLIRLPVSRK